MKVIALEEHMFPRALVDSGQVSFSPRAAAKLPALDDVGEGRLRAMDAAGIDMQVLSALGWPVQQLESDLSAALSADLNDRLAQTVAEHPDRFRAFASLPMTDPVRAADELVRAVEDLGFVGAMIHGQTRGVFLDDPSMRPVLATAARLGVPLYLHPAPPPDAIVDVYYGGLEPDIAECLSTSGWGWHSECGMHVLRMVAAGVFEELPALQLIVGHMGEGLPFHLDRIEQMVSPLLKHHDLTVAETLRRNLHLTTSGYNFDAPLRCALDTFGVERIMFSVDHPFGDSARATAHLRSAPVTEPDRDRIAHGNAATLLSLA